MAEEPGPDALALVLTRPGEQLLVDFGAVRTGTNCPYAFTVVNPEGRACPVHILDLPGLRAAGIELQASLPIVVAARSKVEVPLVWTPTQAGAFQHDVLVQAAFGKARVTLTGKASGPKVGRAVESVVARYRREMPAPRTSKRQPTLLSSPPRTPLAPRTDLNVPPELRGLATPGDGPGTPVKGAAGAAGDDVREEGFKALLNFYLCESPDALPVPSPLPAAGAGPTPGDCRLALHRCRVRARAARLLRSLGDVLHRVGHAVDTDAVALSGELLEAGRRPLAQTLQAYHPLWLRLGLETLFDTTIAIGLQPHCKRQALHRLSLGSATDVNDRCLEFVLQYVVHHPDSPDAAHLRRHVLRAVCMLVLLLDRGHAVGLLPAAPPLFRPDSPFKSSASLLRFVLATYGDGSAEDAWGALGALGYELSAQQSPIEEVRWAVTDVPPAVADGVRIARLLDLWLCPAPEHRLQPRLQPAASFAQQRAQWRVLCDALRQHCNLDVERRGVRVADLLQRRPPPAYALLWLLTLHVLLPRLAPLPDVLQEWGCSSAPVDSQLYVDQPLLQALLGWVNRVCAPHDVAVRNFTAAFADGRAFCFLVASYCPTLLPPREVRAPDVRYQPEGLVPTGEDAATAPGAWVGSFALQSNPEEEAVRRNFRLLRATVAALGGVPPLVRHRDFVDGRCGDERLTATFVACLFQRLREVRAERRAAVMIQRRWRAYHAASPHRTAMATRLQSAWRAYRGRQRYRRARERVTLLQSLVRMQQARRRYRTLRRAALVTQTLRRGALARRLATARRRCAAAVRL
eukprot:EG_transcript_3683